MKNKKLITMFGTIALIGAIGAGSTLAYLTSTTGTVTNTFTVGNVNFEEQLNNGLSESKVERIKGTYEDADGEAWSSDGNLYKDLVAGEVVYKDPTAHMGSDSQDAYLFIRVYNTKAQIGNVAVFDSIDVDESKWEQVGSGFAKINSSDAAEADYVDYVYKGAAKAGEHYTLFSHVTMGNISSDMENIPQIVAKACAVQYAGFTDDAEGTEDEKTAVQKAYAETVWAK